MRSRNEMVVVRLVIFSFGCMLELFGKFENFVLGFIFSNFGVVGLGNGIFKGKSFEGD